MFAALTPNKQWRVSIHTFNAVLACWLASFTNGSFYHKVLQLSAFDGLMQVLFMSATFLLIAGVNFIFLQLISWRASAKTVAVIMIVLTGLTSYFVNQLGVNVNTAQIENVMQTDTREALDLLSIPLLLWVLKIIVVPLIGLLFIQIKPANNLKHLLIGKFGSLAIALFIIGAGLFSFYSQYAPIFRENRELKAQISPLNVISSSWSYSRRQYKKRDLPLVKYGEDAHIVHTVGAHAPKIMVLVVGETARAENFSLNGYHKPTNPELSKLDLVNFTQASSCGTQTSVSVPCMFSGMKRSGYDEALAGHREGLLDIVQRAGYEVTWIDNNSGCKGACDRIQHYISPKDDPRYKNQCKDGECYDGILIDALKDYLKALDLKQLKKDQLIVLHQLGSHGPAYYKRYPAAFKKFTPTCDTNNIQNCSRESLINSYDNTILYTDHVLSTLIHTLDALPVSTGLMYLSDHGESTGENGLYLHGTPYFMAPKEQTHIPMLFWFSTTWPQQQTIKQCLNGQKNNPVSQDNLFPTVLGLLHIRTQVLDSSLDLTAQCRGKL
ncbi:phosphoethanolamine--lipid A transferase [Acinetobacter soli]|uniref:phosphoethanolamine transferase n=1 Tax=Acinetobacter soli TaxID=487316 RepID=UPI002814282D|nr:phosphoethanolamine--lipid A transferase [Acinetobacter soli]MDQ9833797.1 phosphoethanolamine--lipid A transferase [Acinetobacter soli]